MSKNNGGEVTIDDLAIMVANGFSAVDKRFDKLEFRMSNLEQKIDYLIGEVSGIKSRLDKIENQIEFLSSKIDQNRKNANDDLLAIFGDVEKMKNKIIKIEKILASRLSS